MAINTCNATEITYKVTVNFKEIAKTRTFKTAFTIFYHEIQKVVKNGEMTRMGLNEMCHIEKFHDALPNQSLAFFNFNAACYMAEREGILDGNTGKLTT
jgi:hypothetical protein